MTNIPCCAIPLSRTAETEGLTYLEAMYHLCEFINRRLNPDALNEATYIEILSNCQAIERLRERVIPQIRSKEACKSAVDRLQHFAIRLHTSFVVSVCCRPALKRTQDSHLDPSERKVLATKCKQNLTETVRMFLAMHQLSVIPTRSWAFTYHGLSSAVLLGLLPETKSDPEIRQLQGDLISALSATAAKDQTSPVPYISKTDKDIELSGPLSRALAALRNIYDHGHVMGSALKRENGTRSGTRSGTRTPAALNQLTNHIEGADQRLLPPYPPGPVGVGQGPGPDPHQDAALAMAELQNGSGPIGDFTGYVQDLKSFSDSMLRAQYILTYRKSGSPSTLKTNNHWRCPRWEHSTRMPMWSPWSSMTVFSGVSFIFLFAKAVHIKADLCSQNHPILGTQA